MPNLDYNPETKIVRQWNSKELEWLPMKTDIKEDGTVRAWDSKQLEWIPVSSSEPDSKETEDEVEEDVDIPEQDVEKEADPTTPRPAYTLFGDERPITEGEGVISLRPPETKKEEAETRKAMAIAGGGMGLPMLPSDPIGPMGLAAVGNLLKTAFGMPKFVGELLAPETTKKITDAVSEVDKKASENELYAILKKSVEGKGLDPDEDLISRLPSWLLATKVGKEIAKKVTTKFIKDQRKTVKKVLPTKGKRKALVRGSAILGGGTGFVASDVLTRRDDEIHSTPFAELMEVFSDEPGVLTDAADIIRKLEINPEDSTQLKRQKQLLDSVSLNSTLFTALTALFKTPALSKGLVKAVAYPLRTLKKKKAVDDGITEVPQTGKTSQVNSSEVVEEVVDNEPVFKQRNAVTERLAKINTKLGRALMSGAALPKKIARQAIARSREDRASELEVQSTIEQLLRVQKETKTSDDVLRQVINENISEGVDPAMLSAANVVKTTIAKNEGMINKLLGLKGKDKIGLGFNDGDVYFTRMFEAVNNPTYLKEIKKALKFKGGVDDYAEGSDFLVKVQNARSYLKENGVLEKDIDNTISAMVLNLSKKDSDGLLSDMFNDVATNSLLPTRAAQVLRERKKLDDPILELLGVQKDPVAKISATLSNQKKVIAELEYFSEIDKYFRKNIGEKTVELGGLLPKIGGQRVSVFQRGEGVDVGDLAGVDENIALKNIADEAIGRFGGKTKLLKDLYVDPTTYDYVRKGLNYYEPKSSSWLQSAFSQVAAYGQATQTILDLPAYLINGYGAFQGLISNGVLFNTTVGKNAVNAVKIFGQTISPLRKIKPNQEAIEKLAKLQRAGVIDTDLTAELISKNIQVYGKRAGSQIGKVRAFYDKGMQKASTVYGSPDTYAKLVAFEAEQLALKKMFPKTANETAKDYNDRIFELAAERVRATMPSYAVASPIVRELSRLPIGTYALFPSEMVRTTANQLKIGVKDLGQGLKNKNKAQTQQGLKRLTGLSVTGLGIDYLVNTQNQTMGINEDTQRGLDLQKPSWGKGAKSFYLTPIMENEDGSITTRAINSYSFDAQDFLKVPIRQVIGKLLAGKDVTDVEQNEIISGLRSAILGPYTNPKFVTEALINIVRQEYSDAPGEEGLSKENLLKVWDELKPAVQPGTWQVIDRYLQSLKSEVVRGKDQGENRFGFPQTTNDILTWMRTGIRPFTQDPVKGLGFVLSQDIKKIKASRDAFINKIRRLDDQEYNENIENDLINEYIKLQDAKYDSMRNLADKIKIFSKMEYQSLDGKPTPFGVTRVLKGLTDNFWYDIPEEAEYALYTGENAYKGVFIPDNLTEDKGLTKLLLDKKFGMSLKARLAEEYGKSVGLPLRD